MYAFSGFYALGVLAVCFCMASAILRFSATGNEDNTGRTTALDGLRGYLALGVMVHHAALWFIFVRTGKWGPLPSGSSFSHLGEQCVPVFFMITAYLFTNKLLNAKYRHTPIDWTELYVSRILRLSPLYLVAMTVFLFLVAKASGYSLHVTLKELSVQVLAWLTFSIISAPEVNGVPQTGVIISWVVWSLAYEWLFYLVLPILAKLIGMRVSLRSLLACSGWLVVVLISKEKVFFPTVFLGGIAAAFVVRHEAVASFCRSLPCAVFVLTFTAALLGFDVHLSRPTFLIGLFCCFVIVASGNSLLGILKWRPAKLLGDISYGIYLLHGLILYVAFYSVLGVQAANLSAMAHWLMVCGVGLVTVVVSWISFTRMELVVMSRSRGVAAWVKRWEVWLDSAPPVNRTATTP